jgi:hypothetical protein
MNIFTRFELKDWEHWGPPAVGLVLMGLFLLVGPLIFRRRRGGGPTIESRISFEQRSQRSDGSLEADRRTATRRKGNPIEVLITDSSGGGSPVKGTVLDRSKGGVRLVVDKSMAALAVGTILSVRPATAPASVNWIQVQVRHYHPRDDGWVVGCQFVEIPPMNIVLMFG